MSAVGASSYSRRLLIAAVGAASVAVYFYLKQQRRRKRAAVATAPEEPCGASQEQSEQTPIREKLPSEPTPAGPEQSKPLDEMPAPKNETPDVDEIADEFKHIRVKESEAIPTPASDLFVTVSVESTAKQQSGNATALPSGDTNGYKNAESPSGTSTNSEVCRPNRRTGPLQGSADSGRATGGPNCSPFDTHQEYESYPIYEFEVPNTLVGLIIGVQGKTISELCTRAEVRMLIRPHHTPSRMETHQICSIEGKRQNINKCLHMIRYRFPQHRFPDLNLKPVMPPTILEVPKVAGSEPTALSLPVGVPCEVFVCSVVDAGHFFVQLPTHPTFSSLSTLDFYTMNIYTNLAGIPVLPKSCVPGVVCIAPTCNGWFRAITLHHDEDDDTVLVRFADYGGFATLPRTELRQIRSDLTTLPMQAVECYLAHVQPADGTVHWDPKAIGEFTKLCASKIVHAELVGYHKENNIPFVQLCTVDNKKTVKRVDQVLLELGYAKPADPARIVSIPGVSKPTFTTKAAKTR